LMFFDVDYRVGHYFPPKKLVVSGQWLVVSGADVPDSSDVIQLRSTNH
jgi:hypothetical protein